MASVTASVDAVRAVVWIEVEYASDPLVGSARVIRVNSLTGEENYVRIHSWLSEDGDNCITLVGSSATLYDTEAPLDIPVYYRAEGCDSVNIVTSNEVVVPSSGRLWLRDPVRPYANIPITLKGDPNPCVPVSGVYFRSMGAESYPAGGVIQRAVNRRNAIAVVRVRHGYSSTLNLATRTFDDRDAVRSILATGDVLMFQAPAQYGIDEVYIHVPGAPGWERLSSDHRRQWRVVGIGFDEVDRPAGLGFGILGARWADLCIAYPTFLAAETAGLSWRDVMAGLGGAPVDSIVEGWRTYAEVLGEFGTYASITPYTTIVQDLFTRVVAGGWGSATSGQAYTVEGAAAQYTVSGTAGRHLVNALNTWFRSRLATTDIDNFDATVQVTVAAASGNYIRVEPIFRWVDANNFYGIRTHLGTTGAIEFQIIRVSGGVETALASQIVTATHAGGTALNIRYRAVGSDLMAKVWQVTNSEPAAWDVMATDATLVTGQVGLASLLPPGNTNVLPLTIEFDNWLVQAYGRTYLELLEGD